MIFQIVQKYTACLREAHKISKNSDSDGIRKSNRSFVRILTETIPPKYIIEKTAHSPTLAALLEAMVSVLHMESDAYILITHISDDSVLDEISKKIMDTNQGLAHFARGSITCRKDDHVFDSESGFGGRCLQCGISMDLALDPEYQYV